MVGLIKKLDPQHPVTCGLHQASLFDDNGFRINEVEVCGRVSPTAGAREGARLRLSAGLDNMHLIDEASGHVI